MKIYSSTAGFIIASILLILTSCSDEGESTLSNESNVENILDMEAIENRIGGRVDSLIGRWKLSVIEFNEYRTDDQGESKNERISSMKLNGNKSVYIDIRPNGDLYFNDSLTGSWKTDSIRAGITFTGKNTCKHAPIFFETPMFISVQKIYRTLTATFKDINGGHHKTTYYLIYSD